MICIATTSDTEKAVRSVANAIFNNWIINGNQVAISTSNPLSATCVQYSFYSDPGLPFRAFLINYCQRFFTIYLNSNNPTSINPLCTICVDDNQSSLPGIKFSNKIMCSKTDNSTVTTSRILTSTSDLSKFENQRFLQISNSTNSSLTSSNTNANNTSTDDTKTNSAIIDPSTYYNFNICPLQHRVCGTDSFPLGLNFLNYTQSFLSSLNSVDNFTSILNHNAADFVSSLMINDDLALNLNFKIVSSSFNVSNGAFSWNVSNQSIVKCSWYLINNIRPSFDQIISCNDTYNCVKTTIPYD